jgi:hypothetical protein
MVDTYASQSDAVIAGLGEFRRRVDKHAIEWLLREARRHRPGYRNGMSFDDYVEAVRCNYMGQQGDRLRRVLEHRYPVAGKKMPLVPINITTEAAELMAQAYRQEPTRRLFVDGVDPLAPGQRSNGGARSRAEAYRELVKARSSLKTVMPEMERISHIAFSCFGKARWSQVEATFDRDERLEVTTFWPSQVFVIPDPAAPGKLWAARAVILHLDSVADHDVYEVWMRDQVVDSATDEDELELRAGWWFGRFTSEGETLIPFRQYEERDLPIFRITSRPSSSIIPDGDRDLVLIQDEINVQASDHAYKAAFDSHQQIVISGGSGRPGQSRAWGPGVIMEVGTEETVQALPSDYDNLRLEGMQRIMLMFARSHRLPVDAFWTKEGNPETGIAREIRNLAADQKRTEHIEQLEDDEAEMMRLLARIADRWGDLDAMIDGSDASYITRFHPPKKFEDPNQKQQRLKQDRDDGIISPARYAVEMGHYENEDAAELAGLSREVEKKAPPPQLAPFMGGGAVEGEDDDGGDDESQPDG